MFGCSIRSKQIWIALLFATNCWLGVSGVSHAAALHQISEVRTTTLQGSLPLRYSAHYLGLEPTVRDGLVILTLAYEPQDQPNLLGFVNFLVLTEDGLRRYLAGEDARELNIAAGSPLQFDPVGNKMAAAFRDSGRGVYTVIVYNNSELPITYTLTADGAVLVDGSNQTQAPGSSTADTAIDPAIDAGQPILPTVARVDEPMAAPPTTLPGAITARRVSGALARPANRHYLTVQPDVRDGLIAFNFRYDPMDVRELIGNINFWILDEDGLRRMIAGVEPGDLNLGTGFPVPFGPFANELQASFNASGSNPYTVIVFNDSDIPTTYVLSAKGGVLMDQYAQTNEAKVAAIEQAAFNMAAIASATPATVANAPAPSAEGVTLISTSFVANPLPTLATGVERLTGELVRAYQHHYLGLTPTIRDGLIVLTLDFDPKDSQALSENINFWVLDEDGLRRVISGARPEDVDVAAGSPVQYGADLGKLRAVINSSGRGNYTVIVYNNSDVPARYSLRANGGLLSDETAQTSLP